MAVASQPMRPQRVRRVALSPKGEVALKKPVLSSRWIAARECVPFASNGSRDHLRYWRAGYFVAIPAWREAGLASPPAGGVLKRSSRAKQRVPLRQRADIRARMFAMRPLRTLRPDCAAREVKVCFGWRADIWTSGLNRLATPSRSVDERYWPIAERRF